MEFRIKICDGSDENIIWMRDLAKDRGRILKRERPASIKATLLQLSTVKVSRGTSGHPKYWTKRFLWFTGSDSILYKRYA